MTEDFTYTCDIACPGYKCGNFIAVALTPPPPSTTAGGVNTLHFQV
jgi:hypothetical protein